MYIFKSEWGMKYVDKVQIPLRLAIRVSLEDYSLWYRRLGNPISQTLKFLGLYSSNDSITLINKCPVCPLAKQTRLSFPVNDSKTFAYLILYIWIYGNIVKFQHLIRNCTS